MRQATIRYAEGGPSLKVREIYGWNRGDLSGPVMSNSSGPKDYIKNQIWSVFEANPAVDRVVIVRGSGPIFVLMRAAHSWFDVSGKQVVNVEG